MLLASDGDLARLERLRNDPLERNRQHAVFVVRIADLDIVGQLEPALERARSDTAMHVFDTFLVLLGLLTGDDELVLLGSNVDFVRTKPATAILIR